MNRLCSSRCVHNAANLRVLGSQRSAVDTPIASAAATITTSCSSFYNETTNIKHQQSILPKRQQYNISSPLLASSSSTSSSPSSLYCQKIQYRYFDRRRQQKRKKTKNPFKILKIPEGILYKDAKKAFLKIAMTNHPDTIGHDVSDEEREKMRDIFISCRIAFESLTEDSDGTAIRKEDAERNAMENFDSWFKDETGFETPFHFDMDPETMKEVANMTETLGGESGLDRDGGMWALARMVTSTVKAGGDAATMLRLDAGDPKDGKQRHGPHGELRRRRKR